MSLRDFQALDEELADASDDSGDRHYCCAIDERKLRPQEGEELMSYSDRLRETQAVVEALGGADRAGGMLCFKVGEELSDRALKIAEIISKENSLRYCDIYSLARLRRVGRGDRQILVLVYHAEHD